jgi:flagellar basal body-associated protein FliL
LDPNKLDYANERLQQNNQANSKKKFWIIFGIIIGIIIIVIIILFWLIRNLFNSSTYPYIPTPKNTIRSTSIQELLMNILLDANDDAVKYSVISKSDISSWK